MRNINCWVFFQVVKNGVFNTGKLHLITNRFPLRFVGGFFGGVCVCVCVCVSNLLIIFGAKQKTMFRFSAR